MKSLVINIADDKKVTKKIIKHALESETSPINGKEVESIIK